MKAYLTFILNLECISKEGGRFFFFVLLHSFHKSNLKGLATREFSFGCFGDPIAVYPKKDY